MKKVIEIISYIALATLVAAPVLFYTERITLPANKGIMLAATVVWFASALCWMGREKEESNAA